MATFLSNYRHYIAGIGLIGLALYQASQGEASQAGTSALAALAAFGLHLPSVAPATSTAPVAK